MNKSKLIFPLISLAAFLSGCMHDKPPVSVKEIAVPENEKWWDGAVLDGRNSPLNDHMKIPHTFMFF